MHESRARASERDVPFERFHDRIARIAIPIEFFSVPVNVHVILGERAVAIDAGPRTPVARERVAEGLAKLGVDPASVAHVIVTHHHVDHLGLLEEWVARGAHAWAHEDELEGCLDVPGSLERRLPTYTGVARVWGYPEETVAKIGRDFLGYGTLGGRVEREAVSPIRGESTVLPLEGAPRLRAIHVPGHSEGQIVLHDEAANVLFSADHILERVTPNPAFYVPEYRGRTNGLEDYFASLDVLEALPRDILVCPGHGAPFTGLHARLEEIRRHHGERREQVHGLLTDRKQTVLDLVQQIWPGIDRRHGVLGCREVALQLDLLRKRGQAVLDLEGPDPGSAVQQWRRAA